MKNNMTPTHEICLGIIKADIISARAAMDYFHEKYYAVIEEWFKQVKKSGITS